MDEIVKKIYQGIVDGQQDAVAAGVDAALQAGLPARTILEDGMLAAMAEVGRLFEEGECYVPEMLISARAMKTGLAKLQPSLIQTDVQAAGTVALGTVKGDLHDMGKNLVGMMLEGAGFKVKDLGVDVPPETFVAAADEVPARRRDHPLDAGREQRRQGGHRRLRHVPRVRLTVHRRWLRGIDALDDVEPRLQPVPGGHQRGRAARCRRRRPLP